MLSQIVSFPRTDCATIRENAYFVILNLFQNLIISICYKRLRSWNEFRMTIVTQSRRRESRGIAYEKNTKNTGFLLSQESTCRQVGTKKGENVIPRFNRGIQFLFISGFRVKHGMTALTTHFRVNDKRGRNDALCVYRLL